MIPAPRRLDLRRSISRVLGLALGPAVALGLARFSYALLLPPMRAALGWSFATAGLVNTANALGYLFGAMLAATLGGRLDTRRVFVGGIAVTGFALMASAVTSNLLALCGLRLVAGVAGAVVFILGAALAAEAGRGQRPGWAAVLLGVYFGGAGLGIVLSGLTIGPLLRAVGDAAGWRLGWLVLGGIAMLALAAAGLAARSAAPPQPAARGERVARRPLAALVGGYALFGVGYIAYMTFIVAYLRQAGVGESTVTVFWVVLGSAGIAGGFAWGPALGSLRGGRGPATVMTVVAVGAGLPLMGDPHSGGSPLLAFASAVLFGGSFLAVVTAVTTVAKQSLPPSQWTPAIGYLTVAFAAGQCLGPVMAGMVSDGPGGVRAGMGVSAGVLAVGALVALAQPHHRGPAPARQACSRSETSSRGGL